MRRRGTEIYFSSSGASTRRKRGLPATGVRARNWGCRRIQSNPWFIGCGGGTLALLRAEIARTVADPAEIDEEIRYLLRVLGS